MKIKVIYKNSKTILNKGTGFLSGYTHSLNPYTGCSFACSYCYVRQMPVSLFRKEEWGSWVDIKENAATVLEKELTRSKNKGQVTIFMSSSTDPYQPIEYKVKLTRSLLEVMVHNQPDFLFVQTRSPLVKRDIDLLKELKEKVRVSMTVETDLDEIRKYFSPFAPPIGARIKTLEELVKAGIPTQATIAPILPSSEDFPSMLSGIVNRVCIDDFMMGDGSGGKRTTRLGIEQKYTQLNLEEWYSPEAYLLVYERFKKYFLEDRIFISKVGFEP
ncbi:radical SAM protein [Bacillus sp. AFS041924]|uniref:SPL family radical SAM protein n=1 Tax=Bacillus sp. AFS041924 TaxID=2033503 RepID=UPI000BFBE581|nr:radical SAM protein [Bacillus sp. AFS041924]PGS50598.1 radical SAM protein [Bacillus sp. AFS041924]